jgi:hypothetical protein
VCRCYDSKLSATAASGEKRLILSLKNAVLTTQVIYSLDLSENILAEEEIEYFRLGKSKISKGEDVSDCICV